MRFKIEVRADGHQEVIVDTEHQLNFLFIAETGFGLPSTNRKLAQRVVDFLNSLPPEETLLYPYKK